MTKALTLLCLLLTFSGGFQLRADYLPTPCNNCHSEPCRCQPQYNPINVCPPLECDENGQPLPSPCYNCNSDPCMCNTPYVNPCSNPGAMRPCPMQVPPCSVCRCSPCKCTPCDPVNCDTCAAVTAVHCGVTYWQMAIAVGLVAGLAAIILSQHSHSH